jgi:hypothetical protein
MTARYCAITSPLVYCGQWQCDAIKPIPSHHMVSPLLLLNIDIRHLVPHWLYLNVNMRWPYIDKKGLNEMGSTFVKSVRTWFLLQSHFVTQWHKSTLVNAHPKLVRFNPIGSTWYSRYTWMTPKLMDEDCPHEHSKEKCDGDKQLELKISF